MVTALYFPYSEIRWDISLKGSRRMDIGNKNSLACALGANVNQLTMPHP